MNHPPTLATRQQLPTTLPGALRRNGTLRARIRDKQRRDAAFCEKVKQAQRQHAIYAAGQMARGEL